MADVAFHSYHEPIVPGHSDMRHIEKTIKAKLKESKQFADIETTEQIITLLKKLLEASQLHLAEKFSWRPQLQ